MSAPADLGTLLARLRPLDLLSGHAERNACRFAVLDPAAKSTVAAAPV